MTAEVFTLLQTELEPYPPVAEKVIEGELAMRARILFKSSDNRCATGIWQCPPVKLELEHPFNESFVITHGRLTITTEDGVECEMGPGDAIVLSEGTKNIWHIHETVTKMFAIQRDAGLPV